MMARLGRGRWMLGAAFRLVEVRDAVEKQVAFLWDSLSETGSRLKSSVVLPLDTQTTGSFGRRKVGAPTVAAVTVVPWERGQAKDEVNQVERGSGQIPSRSHQLCIEDLRVQKAGQRKGTDREGENEGRRGELCPRAQAWREPAGWTRSLSAWRPVPILWWERVE